MNKFLSIVFSSILLFGFFALTPDVASATAPERLVPCNGTDCSFCHFVSLGNNIISWIFGFVFVIFGVLIFVAGFGLVTSGGNQSALDDAKKKLSNAVIGLIIVMAAWLIVDTLAKAALSGTDGNISGIGPWYQIDCGIAGQSVSSESAPDATSGGGGGGTVVASTVFECSTNFLGAQDCIAAMAQCNALPGRAEMRTIGGEDVIECFPY